MGLPAFFYHACYFGLFRLKQCQPFARRFRIGLNIISHGKIYKNRSSLNEQIEKIRTKQINTDKNECKRSTKSFKVMIDFQKLHLDMCITIAYLAWQHCFQFFWFYSKLKCLFVLNQDGSLSHDRMVALNNVLSICVSITKNVSKRKE